MMTFLMSKTWLKSDCYNEVIRMMRARNLMRFVSRLCFQTSWGGKSPVIWRVIKLLLCQFRHQRCNPHVVTMQSPNASPWYTQSLIHVGPGCSRACFGSSKLARHTEVYLWNNSAHSLNWYFHHYSCLKVFFAEYIKVAFTYKWYLVKYRSWK